jgi:hypothetical protein
MQPAWNVFDPDNAGENARFRGASLASWEYRVEPYTVIREASHTDVSVASSPQSTTTTRQDRRVAVDASYPYPQSSR